MFYFFCHLLGKRRRVGLDFIERMFGIDPDGGSGATELLIVGVIVAIIVLAWFHRTKRRVRVG